MEITINAKPKDVKSGSFNYSNIESPYGVNTQYFTKNGKPDNDFLPMMGGYPDAPCMHKLGFNFLRVGLALLDCIVI